MHLYLSASLRTTNCLMTTIDVSDNVVVLKSYKLRLVSQEGLELSENVEENNGFC